MNRIIRICRFELSTLFYSPIAWALLALFIAQTAFTFMGIFTQMEFNIRMGQFPGMGITHAIFSNARSGLFLSVLEHAYLYIPLLTMGLISKELSSGTIKLVMSSPVKARELIIGKFLAALGYCLLLAGVLLVYVIIVATTIDNADIGLMLSCVFAFLLLASVYCAIGLFISCWTSYQIVAALGTFALLGTLSYVKAFGKGVPILDDLTYWLSISGRAQDIINGLITTTDVFYFVILTILFLAFSVIKISAGREVLSPLMKIKRYTMLFGFAAIAAYVSGIPALTGYLDTSARKHNTLTQASKEIVDQIDQSQVTITSYVNIIDGLSFVGLPDSIRDDQKNFRLFTRYLPEIKFNYVYFYDGVQNEYYEDPRPIKEQFDSLMENYDSLDKDLFITPEQIKQKIDLSSEGNRFVREVSYKGEKTFLRMFNDNRVWPSEKEITAVLKRLLEKGAEKVVFVTGHSERKHDSGHARDYKAALNKRIFRESLVNHGFDFNNVNLNEADIAADTSILVVASPTTEYSAQELTKINAYLANGGNAIILAEPTSRSFVSPIVEKLGISFIDGELHQNNKDIDSNVLLTSLTQQSAQLHPQLQRLRTGNIFMPSAMGLVLSASSDFKATPLLQVNKNRTIVLQNNVPTPISAPVALMLSRNKGDKEQRIIVAGDADWLSNEEASRSVPFNSVNGGLTEPLFSWLVDEEYPANIQLAAVRDNAISLDRYQVKTLKRTLTWGAPLAIFAFGMFLLFRRLKA
jgi:ABC-2 type transport system permease protein